MADKHLSTLDQPTEDLRGAQSRGWDALSELIPLGITSDAVPSPAGARTLELKE